jgi:malto-oligosyltrehalose trehalohydrolase
MTSQTQFQFGPEIRGSGVAFRFWAPGAKQVALEIDGAPQIVMARADDGWHTAECMDPAATLYRFRLPDGTVVPDPASRFQPEGVHGPSLVLNPSSYRWQNTAWQGRPWRETVLYELHVGLLGGYDGVRRKLPELAALGVTAVELMPLAEFAGSRNWGYDGVLPFSPSRYYGSPDALKALVDTAHGLGLMVFLDVVYNHFGPDGNWLGAYAPGFFREDIHTPWGAAIDFRRAQVRRFFTENALYWLKEFRFDGLRLDAVHAISEQDWITEMTTEVRAALPGRHVHIILENEQNNAQHMRNGVNAQWNDDFHNVMHVLLTGENNAYYSDFAQHPTERLARSLAEGFVYQGEVSQHHDGEPRGSISADLPPTAFVNFLQNHDQVGNRALGERLIRLTDPIKLMAATALVLLSPTIPMIFAGEEDGSRSPFLFFTDFHGQLADAVREGRRKEFAAFPAFADREQRETIPDPNAYPTFDACRFGEPPDDADQWRDLYQALLALRHTQIVPRLEGAKSLGAAVIGPKAVTAQWSLGDGTILTIACNLADTADTPVAVRKPAGAEIWGTLTDDSLTPNTTVAWIGHIDETEAPA